MQPLRLIAESLLHFCFPHVCRGCGSDMLNRNSPLCLRCIGQLPATRFSEYGDNPIEKKFWGRMPVRFGMAQYYFTSHSILQRLLH